jgi:hypothetical protein
MDLGILGELERFKLPALAQVPGVKVGRPVVVLVSRSRFTPGLVEAARKQERIILVDPEIHGPTINGRRRGVSLRVAG